MKYLNIKLRRDIRKNWTQFFSVFLMAFLSIVVFVGLQGAWKGLDVSLNKFTEDSNLADYWIQGVTVDQNDSEEIQTLDGIDEVNLKTRITVKRDEQEIIVDASDKFITKPQVVEGKELSSSKEGEIWLNKEYASENDLALGDTVDIEYNNQTVSLTVAGLVQSADRIYFTGSQEYIAPNYKKYGYGYISEETLETSLDYIGQANLLEIKGEHKGMRDEVEEVLGKRFVAYFERTTLPDVSNALERVGQIRNLSFLFSFIFILLAILAMFTTIRRLIESQTTEIAVLKALGFSNRRIGLHYSSFGLFIGGLGSLVGALFSPIISLFVLSTQQNMFSVPDWTISYSYGALVVILLVVLVCVLAAYFASSEAIKGLPALFLRGGNEKRGKAIFLERIRPLWTRLNYASRWAIRDAIINRARILMGIIGVAGGMMLMIAGIGMPQSINHLVAKAYTQDFTYDKRLSINNYQAVRDDYDGLGQWVQITQAHYTPDDGYNRLLIVVSEGNYANMRTTDGKELEEGGIYITDGFAKRAKLSKGQEISLQTSLSDKDYVFNIKGIINSETNQGAYILQDTWEQEGGIFTPSTLLVGKGYDDTNDENVSSVIKIKDQKENAFNFVRSLMSIFMLIIVFAVLLIVVVLYNLGSLSFVERSRDYATLRVLGFHKKELRDLTFVENVITTFIGWLLGIPAGIWFLGQYVATFSTINLEYTPYVNWLTILLASLIVWICSLSTTFFISRRIQKLDMVQALKGVE